MLKTEKAKGKNRYFALPWHSRVSRVSSALLPFAFCLLPFAFLLSGCRQDMHNQPKYIPLRPSAFFGDGRSERQLVDGTVPRRNLKDDPSQSDGDSNGGRLLPIHDILEIRQLDLAKATTLPFPLTQEVMDRGQEQFNISCSPCHGPLGDGNGMVAQRGYRHPPSFHIDRLRQAPIGHFYDVPTNGFGAMPSYSDQVAPRDRWAIAAYIRALQLSRGATLADVPPAERGKLGGQKQ
jgi:mono/diheme cytochrome c family protein